jgi:hypothetical protein
MDRIANVIIEPEEHEEIDVTPEMIAAGLAAYYSGDRRFDLDDEIVLGIYRSMERARNNR